MLNIKKDLAGLKKEIYHNTLYISSIKPYHRKYFKKKYESGLLLYRP